MLFNSQNNKLYEFIGFVKLSASFLFLLWCYSGVFISWTRERDEPVRV